MHVKSSGNFQPSLLSDFYVFSCESMAGNWVFSAGNYLGQQVFQVQIYDNNFQPSKSGQ
jgi:hypothetical protein